MNALKLNYIIFISCILQLPLLLAYPATNELQPFTTDGCSIVPDFSFTPCCVAHDLDYWAGGTYEQRKQSDKNLKSCIEKKSNALVANMFYWGVRMGGSPDMLSSYRWGYGWKYGRRYSPLSDEEKNQIIEQDPGDIFAYTIKSPSKNYAALPTQYTNYCLDQVYEYIGKKYDSDLNSFSIKGMRETSDHYFTKLKITMNNIDKITFTYKNKDWEYCDKPQYYLNDMPKFYLSVKHH